MLLSWVCLLYAGGPVLSLWLCQQHLRGLFHPLRIAVIRGGQLAVAVGRSVVRATNSGVSIVVDPSGETVAVLEDGEGQRKMARGTLVVQVPVPLGGHISGIDRPQEGSYRTFWVRTGRFQPVFWAILVGLLVVFGGGGVTRGPGRVRPTQA